MNLNGCTCGPYMSVIPPEPCPIHDPERAYWRIRLLREFGEESGYTTTTTTVTGRAPGTPEPQFDIPKYESPKVKEELVHYNPTDSIEPMNVLCGQYAFGKDIRWARILNWVTCEKCKRATQLWKRCKHWDVCANYVNTDPDWFSFGDPDAWDNGYCSLDCQHNTVID